MTTKNILSITLGVFLFVTHIFAQSGNVGIGTATPKTKLDINGGLSLREGSPLFLSNGANNDIAFTDSFSFFRIVGPTADFSITGIVPASGANGQILTLVNTSGNKMTISNLSGNSNAANQIKTLTGSDLAAMAGNSSVTLQYNKADQKWYVTGTQNFSVPVGAVTTGDIASSNNAVILSNNTGRLVGGATMTLDIKENDLNQKGLAKAPTSSNNSQVYGTDASGYPAWQKINNDMLINKNISINSGSGISVGGTPVDLGGTLTITNTAPDQTVTLTSGTGISVTGTYPNFTISNSGGTVTSISGTAPISVTNPTTTPNISMTQANTSSNGWLSSTDWNTFSSKPSGSGTQNYIPKWTPNGTTLSNSQIFDNGTNVGIGTVYPNNKLSVVLSANDVIPTLGLNGGSFALLKNDNNAAGNYGFLMGVLNNGNVFQQVQRTDASASAYHLLLQPNGGNVGIGTPSPSQKLDVNGGFRTAAGNLTILNDYIYVSPTNKNTLNSGYSENSTVDMWVNYRGYNDGMTQTRNFNIGDGKGANIAWFDGVNRRVSINNGQTANFPLDVAGDINSSTGYRIGGGAASGNYLRGNGSQFVSSSIQAGDIPDLSDTYIKNQSSQQTSANFNIDGTGTVGSLKFTAPTGDPSPLITARTVPAGQGASNEKTELILFHSNDNNSVSGPDQITLRAPSLSFQTYDNATVSDINNNAGYNERMYIQPDGNVGINNTDPRYKLHVNVNNNGLNLPLMLQNLNGTESGGNAVGIGFVNEGNADAWTKAAIVHERTNGYGVGKLHFLVNNSVSTLTVSLADARMTIQPDGKVGIGTTSPDYPLDIGISANCPSLSNYGYLNNSDPTGKVTNGSNFPVSIRASARIIATEFAAVSDKRIKTDIRLLNRVEALDKINQIKAVQYEYIDKISKGSAPKMGFIAQEVEQVLPNAVHTSIGYIPNVFATPAQLEQQGKILKITTNKPHEFSEGDKIKLYDKENKMYEEIVDRVISSNEFYIENWEGATDNLFIYGKKIDDFRTIDFDQITGLSVAAIQELTKRITVLETENTILKSENEILKSTKANVSEVEQLKLQIEGLKKQMMESKFQTQR